MSIVFPLLQAEIKRLQEANKIASRERQLMLMQSEEIQRIRQSAQKVWQTLQLIEVM